jgi:hypothetical protein
VRQGALGGSSPCKPFAVSESRCPSTLRRRITCFLLPCRNIRQIDVASDRFLVLAKHRVNGLCELGAIRSVDTAGVYPKV